MQGGDPVKYRVCLYQKTPDGYKVIEKSDAYESKAFKIFSIGSIFAYSVSNPKAKTALETLGFISEKKSVREI